MKLIEITLSALSQILRMKYHLENHNIRLNVEVDLVRDLME